MFDFAKMAEMLPKMQEFISAALNLIQSIQQMQKESARELQVHRLILSKLAEDKGIDVAALDASVPHNDETRSA